MKKSELQKVRLYPHFKLTDEDFPRLLATRKLENDGSTYFGAFLPVSGARVLLRFAIDVFKLRGCDIEIDGNFDEPCSLHYRKQCLAPCVEKLCSREEYQERVELVRLFLGNHREELEHFIVQKIENRAEVSDFETAAYWRDVRSEVAKVWGSPRGSYWASDAIDSWQIIEEKYRVVLNLVSQRGRKILGTRSIIMAVQNGDSAESIAKSVFCYFYKAYRPKEIRVFRDLSNRKSIADELSKLGGDPVKIVFQTKLTPTTKKGFRRNKFATATDRQIDGTADRRKISKNLQRFFGLESRPRAVEAVDVAHISGSHAVVANVRWEVGMKTPEKSKIWSFGEMSEPAAMYEAIRLRFSGSGSDDHPDLLLIDGAKTQMRSALKGVGHIENRTFKIIAAVKPPQDSGKISYFIDENFHKLEGVDSAAMKFLIKLRDSAHELANQTHGEIRDVNPFQLLAKALPGFSESERRSVLRAAGSLRTLFDKSEEDLEKILGKNIASRVYLSIQRSKIDAGQIYKQIVPVSYTADGGDAEDINPVKKYRL